MLAALLLVTTFQTDGQVIPLWPNGAPGSEARRNEPETKPHPWSIGHIYNPSLTVFLPPAGKSNGTAVIIAPGGGHSELSYDGEGVKPAKFFNSLGITAFVLKYRLFRETGSNLTFDKDTRADTFRAIRVVRSHAAAWGIDPKKIGMVGFSAGGENTSLAAFSSGTGDQTSDDTTDKLSERPNFAVWIYPGPLGIPDKIPADSPPGFMLVAQDDDHTTAVLQLVDKYRAAKVPYELHIIGSGGHGFGMGDQSKQKVVNTWSQRLADWLSDNHWLD